MAARPAAREPASPRDHMRAGWRWIDEGWLGDLIGAVCLFGLLWAGLFLTLLWEAPR